MERHTLRIVSGNSPETMGNCAFPQNFQTMKLSEMTVFYAAIARNYAETVSFHKLGEITAFYAVNRYEH